MKQIAIVGIDGCGKTTLADSLYKWLSEECGKCCFLARTDRANSSILAKAEKSMGAPIPDSVRLTAYALDLAAKSIQVSQLCEPDYVIWDRFSICLEAYFEALDVQLAPIKGILSLLECPNYLFWLDVNPHIALQRIALRGGIPKALENEAYLGKVRRAYAKREDAYRISRIDASLPLEKVFEAVKLVLTAELDLSGNEAEEGA